MRLTYENLNNLVSLISTQFVERDTEPMLLTNRDDLKKQQAESHSFPESMRINPQTAQSYVFKKMANALAVGLQEFTETLFSRKSLEMQFQVGGDVRVLQW